MKQKIFDLTRGKYPSIYDNTYIGNEKVARRPMFFDEEYDTESLLSNVPVFLVESSMANENIDVPGFDCIVRVPCDKSVVVTDENFDIDEWINSKEGSCDKPIKERIGRSMSIVDLLGVYVYSDTNDLIPRRIFIWVDKIMEYAENNTDKTNYLKQQVECNAKKLFYLVLYHELAHALMDVGLYGKVPAPNFSYANDCPYRFIEEAYANAIALEALINTTSLTSSEKAAQRFVIKFVKSQGAGYREGWSIFVRRPLLHWLIQWMYVKLLFNYDIACLLREFWKDKHIFIPTDIFESVGRKGWLVVQDRNKKWCMTDLSTAKPVNGFKKYDSFWSFDEYGLCLVRLDLHPGYLYGYVNEQGVEQIPIEYEYIYSIEDGITIAKKNGIYGAVDINNNIIFPLGLYAEVRGFRNGRAAVKDHHGKWGVIDTKGNLIVPCTSDRIVL